MLLLKYLLVNGIENIMRRSFVTAMISGALAIATVIPATQTLGQNSTNTKSQRAIEIVAKKLKVPLDELQVTKVVNVDGIRRLKVLHRLTARIETVNLNQNNGEVSVEQVKKVLKKSGIRTSKVS